MALRFAEELLLLILNEDRGDLAFVPEPHLNLALAGAVLMDLVLENRIDTDLEKLVLVDSTPVEDDLLDPTLADIAQNAETHNAEYYVRRIAQNGEQIRNLALARLLKTGILASAEEGAIALARRVVRSRRYPIVEGKAVQEVQLRIMRVLFSDDIPDPRDIVLICLADACGIFEKILSKEELQEASERINTVSRLDLIGRAIAEAVRESAQALTAPSAVVAPKQIPMVKGLPIFGSAREAAKDIRAFLTKQYLELGPVFEIRILNQKILVLAGPEANQFVNRKGRFFFRSYEPYRGLSDGLDASRMILNMDGPEHVRYRQAFAPAFSRARLQNHLDIASDIARGQVRAWPLDQPIRPLHALQHIIADQMGTILSGTPASTYLEDLVFLLETLLKTTLSQLPMFLFRRRFRKARQRLKELAQETLKAHEPGGPRCDAGDLVNDIIDLHRSDPQFLPETDLMAVVLAPYLVGIETVATTCAFTLYASLKHPDLLARMTAEADALFAAGEHPTAESLRQLDVTHRVVLESLRMYPAAPTVFRTVSNSFDFAGYHIPAGRMLFVATTVTHRLPEYFPDPDRFDIDRYSPERAEHRQPNAYVPFGVGTHRCLGASFAEMQTLLTLAAILREAELVLDPPGYELKMTNVPTPRPAKSFKFKVARRR